MLTLNLFQTFFWYFSCWLWTSKRFLDWEYRQRYLEVFHRIPIPGNLKKFPDKLRQVLFKVKLQAYPPLFVRTRIKVFSGTFPTFFKIVFFSRTPVKDYFWNNENRDILLYWVNIVFYYKISTNLCLEKHWFDISIFLTGWFNRFLWIFWTL